MADDPCRNHRQVLVERLVEATWDDFLDAMFELVLTPEVKLALVVEDIEIDNSED